MHRPEVEKAAFCSCECAWPLFIDGWPGFNQLSVLLYAIPSYAFHPLLCQETTLFRSPFFTPLCIKSSQHGAASWLEDCVYTYRSGGLTGAARGRVPRQKLTECSIMQPCRGSCAPRLVLCSWLLSRVMSAVSTSVILRCAREGAVRVPGWFGSRRLLLKGIPVLACCRGEV